MKKIIRRKITIKTANLKITKSGAVEKGNAHDSEIRICPVCQTPIPRLALQAIENRTEICAATDSDFTDSEN